LRGFIPHLGFNFEEILDRQCPCAVARSITRWAAQL